MLENQIDRIIALSYDGRGHIDSHIASAIADSINEFVGTSIAQPSQFLEAQNSKDLHSVAKNILAGQIESLRDTGTEEMFADFERRLTLASIDELWMNHIDQMAHLREEVAFEGYAQKNPLVVYKERAYESFVHMMADIEYRVIKGLLTAKPQESIESVKLENALREDYTETGMAEKLSTNIPEEKPEITVIRLSDDKK